MAADLVKLEKWAALQAKTLLMKVIEDETYNRLMAEEREEIARKGLQRPDILIAKERGRIRFLEEVNRG